LPSKLQQCTVSNDKLSSAMTEVTKKHHANARVWWSSIWQYDEK